MNSFKNCIQFFTESSMVASAQVALNLWLCVKGLGRCKQQNGIRGGRTKTEAWFGFLDIFVSFEHCPRKQSDFQDMVILAYYFKLDTAGNQCENCIWFCERRFTLVTKKMTKWLKNNDYLSFFWFNLS